MQPYRLEMGTRLATMAGNTLYQYWGSQIAEYLNTQAALRHHARDREPGLAGILQGGRPQGPQGACH